MEDSKIELSSFLQVQTLNLGGVKVQAAVAEHAVEAFGSVGDEAQYTVMLSRALEGAETIGETDTLSAEGYMSVLGAAIKHPLFARMPAHLVGKAAVQSSRMANVMRVGTERQAREVMRPNVMMTMEFNHLGPGPLEITQRPNIPGVPTDYKDAPLALRQTPIFLISGSYSSAKIIFKVAELPSVKLVSPPGVPAPAGTTIQRWSPASYQAGLAPPALRDTDEITLQTEFTCISTATAAVSYQVNWEFRADMAFGAGSRCIQTRGASVLRGPARIQIR